MSNAELASLLLEVADILEFLEENPFKAKAFRNAARSIASLEGEAARLVEQGLIHTVKGIGPSIAAVLTAWVVSRDFSFLHELRSRLPEGYEELRKVAGLGAARLRVLWKELGIERLEDLQRAVREGRLEGVKGFSMRHIRRIEASVEEILSLRGLYRLDEAWAWMSRISKVFEGAGIRHSPTGVCRRAMETIASLEFVCEDEGRGSPLVGGVLASLGMERVGFADGWEVFSNPLGPGVRVFLCGSDEFASALFVTTGAHGHVEHARRMAEQLCVDITPRGVFKEGRKLRILSEEEIYAMLGVRYVPAEVREGRDREWALEAGTGDLVDESSMEGVFHVHTSMSDAKAPLPVMIRAAVERGYTWVGISDHSKSAYYAGGLSERDLIHQMEEIRKLNETLEGMVVFSGVESDILADGSLDYSDDVLKRLDFVIASVHSHFDMSRSAMTERVIKAVSNPCTTMLGHPTGRLILARRPYELDVDAVLKEAVRYGVIIELNAHPMRLDIDWRLVEDFVSEGGMIAINPDAHAPEGFDDMRYGIIMARKGLLPRSSCVNCMDAEAVRRLLERRR